jgi:diguanylate cyclase (GGDEF)-like protein
MVAGRWATSRQAAGDAVHQAAVLFFLSGIIGVVNDLLPTAGPGRSVALVLDSANGLIGLIALRLPWRRWPARATLVMPTLACANLAANKVVGVLPPGTLGVWIVLVFVWIGLWHPPRTALAMAPVAAAAYLVPFVFGSGTTGDELAAITISIPVAVLVGETLARRATQVRRAEEDREAALAALALASVTDDLTGVGNRRQANTMLDALEDGDALVILDIDHFKRVNDTLGHHRGDEVLHEFGAFLARAVRGDDTVARYGGEEFVVVLRHVGDAAMEATERLLDAWRATRPPVTVSAGVAVKRPTVSWSVTFSQADAALYQAKHTGRDRAVLHDAGAVSGPTAVTAIA